MSEQAAAAQVADHDQLWNDRLQDWLDGERVSADALSFAQHLAGCSRCQTQLAAFEELDTALQTAAPPTALDDAFDLRLFERIDAQSESTRVQARQRLEQEMQDDLQALARRWWQNLAFVIPGVVAGIALALALVGWFGNSGISHQLAAEGAQELGRQAGSFLQMLVTAIVGAGIGFVVANWLSQAYE